MITKVVRIHSIPIHPRFEVILPKETIILGVGNSTTGGTSFELITLERPELPAESRILASYTDNSVIRNAENQVYLGNVVVNISGNESGEITPVRFCLFEMLS